MGMFDFISDIGNKIFGDEAEAAEKIQEHIEADNPGIQDLEVSFDEGKVSLSGQAESSEALEKAFLMAGNVKGVHAVDTDNVNAPSQKEKVEYYVIQSGDTLSALAKKYYGNAMDYPRIFEANREVIKDPDKIFIGQRIRILVD